MLQGCDGGVQVFIRGHMGVEPGFQSETSPVSVIASC